MIIFSIKHILAFLVVGITGISYIYPPKKEAIPGYLSCFLLGIGFSSYMFEKMSSQLLNSLSSDDILILLKILTRLCSERNIGLSINLNSFEKTINVLRYANENNIKVAVKDNGIIIINS